MRDLQNALCRFFRKERIQDLAALTGKFFLLQQKIDRKNKADEEIRDCANYRTNCADAEINNISGRVEEILKAQNDLTADYGTELVDADLRANTVTFRLRAVPKTFEDGMSAVFMANSGTGPIEEPGQLSEGTVFSAEVTTALTDDIALSVVFLLPDGTRQTQLLDTYEYAYTDSIPDVWMNEPYLFGREVKNGVLPLIDEYVAVGDTDAKMLWGQTVSVEHVELGIFVNQAIVAWGEQCSQPDCYQGDWSGHIFFRLPDVEVKLQEGDKLQVAALVTDNYGRQFMAGEIPCVLEVNADGVAELTYPTDGRYDSDPDNWVLTNYETAYHTTTPIYKVDQ